MQSHHKVLTHGTEVSIWVVDAKVFGDGTHESTQLVLDALYHQRPEGKTVFDMGTGTGIQSIFAKKWGASEVLAVDILPECIFTARRNFKDNHVDVTSRPNIYNEFIDDEYDITVVNLPHVGLLEYLPMAPKTMKNGGVLIFSWPRVESFDMVDLDGYDITEHLEGVEYDAYVIRRRAK